MSKAWKFYVTEPKLGIVAPALLCSGFGFLGGTFASHTSPPPENRWCSHGEVIQRAMLADAVGLHEVLDCLKRSDK